LKKCCAPVLNPHVLFLVVLVCISVAEEPRCWRSITFQHRDHEKMNDHAAPTTTTTKTLISSPVENSVEGKETSVKLAHLLTQDRLAHMHFQASMLLALESDDTTTINALADAYKKQVQSWHVRDTHTSSSSF